MIIITGKYCASSKRYEKSPKLIIIGRSTMPAPAGDGTPVKKLSKTGFVTMLDVRLNLANLKQQQII